MKYKVEQYFVCGNYSYYSGETITEDDIKFRKLDANTIDNMVRRSVLTPLKKEVMVAAPPPITSEEPSS
jgi:hypothetical protein